MSSQFGKIEQYEEDVDALPPHEKENVKRGKAWGIKIKGEDYEYIGPYKTKDDAKEDRDGLRFTEETLRNFPKEVVSELEIDVDYIKEELGEEVVETIEEEVETISLL